MKSSQSAGNATDQCTGWRCQCMLKKIFLIFYRLGSLLYGALQIAECIRVSFL
jgi:hypothetical protein